MREERRVKRVEKKRPTKKRRSTQREVRNIKTITLYWSYVLETQNC